MIHKSAVRNEMDRVKRIREILRHFDIDQTTLADYAGVKKQAVTGWLHKGARPGADALIKLRKRLNINDVWLLYGEGPMILPEKDKIRREIDDLLDQADEADLQYFHAKAQRIFGKNDQE